MTQPQVSVGIPAYDRPAFVEASPVTAVQAGYGKIEDLLRDDPSSAAGSEKVRPARELVESSSFPARGGRL